jgi:hypothetical protein
LGGQGGGRADSIDIDVEDDGSFRLGRLPPGHRRRLALDRAAAAGLDLRPPRCRSTAGRRRPGRGIAINGRGQGLATLEGGGGVLGAFNYNDVFEPAQPLHFAPAPGAEPQPASSEHREVIAAWLEGARSRAGSSRSRRSRSRTSSRSPGPTSGRRRAGRVGADLLGGFAVAMAQGAPTSRAITVAVQDRAAGRPGPIARNAWQSGKRRSSAGARAVTCGGRCATASSSAARWWARRPARRWCRRSRSAAGGRSSTR